MLVRLRASIPTMVCEASIVACVHVTDARLAAIVGRVAVIVVLQAGIGAGVARTVARAAEIVAVLTVTEP